MKFNGTMMQYFEWNLSAGILWRQMRDAAGQLASEGISSIWIPPACKGSGGRYDQGYGVYDLYDLGEFDQKDTVETKYGHRSDLLAAIRSAHEHQMDVYADIVLDHLMGADAPELVKAEEYNPDNRLEGEGELEEIKAWTRFTYPGRKGKYSGFQWNWRHFTGIDYDEKEDRAGVFKFQGKYWEKQVDEENGNYDYLMGASLDLNNPEVTEELIRWGKWFVETTGVDGFRLDAVKHMKFTFYNDWLAAMRASFKKEFFAVGEYWHRDLAALKNYVDTTEGALSLFDVPLHFRFYDASRGLNSYDMRTIFDDTLTQDNPNKAVTFVDNHDTQPGQALESWVEGWFRPQAYAMILLRQDGYPCVFYGDYYGLADGPQNMRDRLLPLLKARRLYAYGKQNDYLDHPNTIGWTREGDEEHDNSGLAVLLTNGSEGEKRMYVGEKFAGSRFRDLTGNHDAIVEVEQDGNGMFKVRDGSVSVWVRAA